jgi:hypothetical protein
LFSDISIRGNLGDVALKFRGIGLSSTELAYAVAFVGLVLVYDLVDSRKGFWESIRLRPLPIRWAVYYGILILVLFFSPYNKAQNFIYFQF